MPVNVLFLHEFFFKFHALIAIFFLGGCPKFVAYIRHLHKYNIRVYPYVKVHETLINYLHSRSWHYSALWPLGISN